MRAIFENKLHSGVILVTFLALLGCFLAIFLNIRSGIKEREEQLAILNAQYAAVSEENAQYEYILNEADIVEQYEYQAREIGYGYQDEMKVIEITPGS